MNELINAKDSVHDLSVNFDLWPCNYIASLARQIAAL